MSGHSKWSTIKRKKGAIDKERSKIFQKLAKEIYVAAKNGDPDPDINPSLRMVVEKAKGQNMPNDNIERAIKKATGKTSAENYDFIRYEGYANSGIAIIIDCLTDNKNRTASAVRSTLTKRGGNLGTSGSVEYLFNKKGIIVIEKELEEEIIMENVLENGAIDFITNDDNFEIYSEEKDFINIKKGLEKLGIKNFIASEVTFVPDIYIEVDNDSKEKILMLIEELEELDDVQDIYHNLKM